jgi:hypothetical protein
VLVAFFVELVELVVFFVLVVVVVVFFVVLVELVVFFVLVELVVFFVVVDVLLADTMLPASEHGKSRSPVEAMFVQKYSDEPLVPTRLVPVAVISLQISLQTIVTTSLLLLPVPVTLM